MVLVKTLIEIAKVGIKYGQTAGRIASGEATFISRFPPGYRGYAKDIIKGFTTVTYGGIIADLLTTGTDTTGGNGQIPKRSQFKTNKFSKKYSRYNRPYGRSRGKYYCKPCPSGKRLYRDR